MKQNTLEQWECFEIELDGPSTGNPFVDVELRATFTQGDESLTVDGFYDGGNAYRIRFMPTLIGEWTYTTSSNVKTLDGKTGTLTATSPTRDNHGPVRVAHQFHFEYADGTPYRQVGTTAYAWTHQGEELEQQTLESLRTGPFNKMRMCVFPKNYAFNSVEPPLYPFEGTPPNQWDYTRLNPAFFRHFEKRVKQLMEMGIEADVILFHPYDRGRWGFDRMSEADDDRYLKYVIARLGAFRNVWWSLANEFDFMTEKKPADWDRYASIVVEKDPYLHLRSIHNGRLIYDHNQKWVTHVSMQNGSAVEDFGRAVIYRDCYRKPVVYDEVKYEGNIPQRWGNISAQEMVHRFWQGLIGGSYVGHGETYLHPQDIIWWARGGKLHGQSPARLKFFREVLDDSPRNGIEPIDKWQDLHTAGRAGEYYLVYFGHQTPTNWTFELPRADLADGMRFTAEILDTWNMTVTPVEGEFEIALVEGAYRYRSKGDRAIPLQGKPFIAIRIKRVAGDKTASNEGAKIFGEF